MKMSDPTTTTEEMLGRLCDAIDEQTVQGAAGMHSRNVGIALTAARAHLARPPDPVAAERLTTEPEVEEAFRLNDPDSLIARLASDVWLLEDEFEALTKSRDAWKAKADQLLDEMRLDVPIVDDRCDTFEDGPGPHKEEA